MAWVPQPDTTGNLKAWPELLRAKALGSRKKWGKIASTRLASRSCHHV